jgi:hypothetical protein
MGSEGLMADMRTIPVKYDRRLLDEHVSKIEHIPLSDVQVDPAYQRPLREGKLAEILRDFDASELTAIVVSRRSDGTYWVLDGQHRCEVMRRLGRSVVLADIRDGLSLEDEARLFWRLNDGPTRVGAWDKFKARLTAKEPRALQISRVVEANSYHVGRTAETGGIQAVAALDTLYSWGWLDATLEAIGLTWGMDRLAVESESLRGVAIFLATWSRNEHYDHARFLRLMEEFPPSQVMRWARKIRAETGIAGQAGQAFALALRDMYNGVFSRGQTAKHKLSGNLILPQSEYRPRIKTVRKTA